VRGGNGRTTEPQRLLFEALGDGCEMEYAISLGKKVPGYPTCYKVDLAFPERRLAIEVDGPSHRYGKLRERDEKKVEKLASLGWRVLRFWNSEILQNLEQVKGEVCSALK